MREAVYRSASGRFQRSINNIFLSPKPSRLTSDLTTFHLSVHEKVPLSYCSGSMGRERRNGLFCRRDRTEKSGWKSTGSQKVEIDGSQTFQTRLGSIAASREMSWSTIFLDSVPLNIGEKVLFTRGLSFTKCFYGT